MKYNFFYIFNYYLGLVMPLVQSNQMNGFWMGGQKSGSDWKWTDGSEGKVYLILTHFIQELLNVYIISNIL